MFLTSRLHLIVILFTIIGTVTSQCPTTACTCEGNIINCRYKSLTQIPTFSASSQVYDKIDFSSTEETGQCTGACNVITQVPKNAFKNLNVKVIDLRRNAITSFNDEAFIDLQNVLEGLYIEGAANAALPSTSLAPLNKLSLLHLENFRQTSLSLATPIEFDSLQTFTLDNIQDLSDIKSNLFARIPNVKELTLHRLSSLTTLPVAAILTLVKLDKFKIIDTSIGKIYGDSFQSLTALTELHIDRNLNLNDIQPNAFSGVSNTLKFLSIQYSLVTDIDFFLPYAWPQLTQLNLDYNSQINVATSKFTTLTKLQYLNLQDAGITAVDKDMFKGLTRMQSLDLSYNQISVIKSDAFQHMPSLTELKLIHDRANTINFEDNAFKTIENSIRHIFLEQHSFDHGQFWSTIKLFHNLRELSVLNSNLNAIPDYAFSNNEQLTTLEFADNGITSVSQETFYGPRNTLKTIQLQGNKIETLSKCAVYDFPTKPDITLRQNPLKCDCQIKWFYDWVKGKSQPGLYVENCESPANLKGTPLYNVDRTLLTCASSYIEPVCSDLYATNIVLQIAAVTISSITVTWSVSDKSDITGYRVELLPTSGAKQSVQLQSAATQHEFTELQKGSSFTICLFMEINGVYADERKCKTGETTSDEETTQSVMTTAAPQSQTGVIVGASVGVVVLIALVIAIVLLMLKKKHKRKPLPPPSQQQLAGKFGKQMDKGKEQPNAPPNKRYVHTPSNKGVTKPEDINIKVISSGNLNPNDRVSSGSYQTLQDNNNRNVDRNPQGQGGEGRRSNVRTINERIPAAARNSAAKERNYGNTDREGNEGKRPVRTINDRIPAAARNVTKGHEYGNTDQDGNVVTIKPSENVYNEVQDTLIL